MFSKLNLKAKLLFLCLFLSVVTTVVGLSGLHFLEKVGDEYEFIVDKVAPKFSHASRMFSSYRKLRVNVTILGLPSSDAEKTEKWIQTAKEAISEYEREKQSYIELKFIPGQKELFDKVDAAWTDFKSVSEEAFKLAHSSSPQDRAALLKLIAEASPQKAVVYTEAIENLLRFHENVMDKKSANATELSSTSIRWTISMIIGGVILGLLGGFLIAASLTKTLSRISESILVAAERTSSGGLQLAAASSQLSAGSTEAAASLEETVASIEELSSMVKMNTSHACEANNLSQKSRESAEKGEGEILKLIESMSEIANGSKKIEEIIKVIDEIAFQTNLLALNAAVEAARAGDQGKGFAVVAEAVRGLAQRSAVAAKDISSLITDNVAKSERGAKIASESGAALKEILVSVKKVADLNTEIAAGSQEQASGLEQITKAMNQLDQATQGNAASSEEVAESSDVMSKQAHALAEMVDELQKIVHGEKRTHHAPAPSQPKEKSKGTVVALTKKTPRDSGSLGDVSGF